MRLTRRDAGQAPNPALTYGEYFKGITDVLSKNEYRLIVDAAASQLARDISLADIEEILIYAEKHGSDYHPARIEVMANEVRAAFVMNVAVTARGRERVFREFEVLQRLNNKYDSAFLPEAYFKNEVFLPSMVMFLADWFQGYHEFHLSTDKDATQRLALWDTDKDHCYFSGPQVWQVYSQAARIMTLYYDIDTFEQIFPWHHAAGDFVVKAQMRSVDVRLVTARQYAPMLERSAGISVYEALLFFLLNLSVRMRLDRLDGIGTVAWADDHCVDATLEGFLGALRMKEQKGAVPAGFVDAFLGYSRSLVKKDLAYRYHALVDACDQAAPDIPVIRYHLKRHISKFYSALRNESAQ